jgi:hypothetical protein
LSIYLPTLASTADGPLTIKDVEGFEAQLNIEDQEILKLNKIRNRELTKYRVGYVNKHYREWQKVWPDGRPIEFYKALQVCQENFDGMIKKESFRRTIRKEVENIVGLGAPALRVSLTHESADQSPEINISPENKPPDVMAWSAAYRKKVIQLILDEYSPNEIQLKTGIRVEQQEAVRSELDRLGLLVIKQRKVKKKKENTPITGFTFIKNGKKYRAGMLLLPAYDPELNPFKGKYDIMSVLFKRPMMCPLGYVLDYESWVKIFESTHTHPYTHQRIPSFRCLTRITTENFEENRGFIKNLPEGV